MDNLTAYSGYGDTETGTSELFERPERDFPAVIPERQEKTGQDELDALPPDDGI